jgi:hypothetical protein
MVSIDDAVATDGEDSKKPTERLSRHLCLGYKMKSHEYFLRSDEKPNSIQYCNRCNDEWTRDNQQYVPPFDKTE